MLEIKCTVPRFELVEDGANSMMQSLTLLLDEKNTSYSVKGIKLYKSKYEVLSADVVIPYEYDRQREMIKLSAPDYQGEKGFKTTFIKNGKHVEVDALESKDVLKQWSSAYTEALYEHIIEYARENKMTILTRNNWNKQLLKDIWVYYKDSVFYGLSSKEHSEISGVKSVPIEEVDMGSLELGPNTKFWNVIGSSCDFKPNYDIDPEVIPRRGGWIGLLDQYVYKYHHIMPQQQCICKQGDCRCKGSKMVGAHIVLNENDVKPRKTQEDFPDGIVGLLPICSAHNYNLKEEIQMRETAVTAYGIWLNQYSGKM